MQQAQSVLSLVNTSDDQPSTESLDNIKSELTHTMSLLTSKGNDISPTDYLELVACSIGHTVLTTMLQNEVLLLPELYRQYCNTALNANTKYPGRSSNYKVVTEQAICLLWRAYSV